MQKLTALLKKTGIATIGGLLLATSISACADPVKEQEVTAQTAGTTAAAKQTPKKAVASAKKDTKKKAKKDNKLKKDKKAKKKKHQKKSRLEKKHPERASGSK